MPDASIRPRRWSRGELDNKIADWTHSGVASIRPRRWSRGERLRGRLVGRARPKLQFGHGVGAVENVNPQGGPPATTPLQFGHGVGAVENDGGTLVEVGCWHGLQFGHGVGAVENAALAKDFEGLIPASIRPRRWSRGEPH